MSSPRSMWSGSLQLGLLNVPITLAKAAVAEREKSIKQVCSTHHTKIDRSERCEGCDGPPEGKSRAVEKDDGSLHVLSETQWNFIEGATKLPTLEILDVQPLDTLPLEFATGAYFLRPDKKAPGAKQPFRILYEALDRKGYGLITKLSNASSQKLAVIRASKGTLLLQIIPHITEIREPGEQELGHNDIASDEAMVEMAVELLDSYRASNGFDHGDDRFADEGLKLRHAAVEEILNGNEPSEPKSEPKAEPQPDLMDQLQASIERAKKPTKA